MSIFVNDKIFHIQTPNTSYIMDIMNTGDLCHLYFGNKLSSKAQLQHSNLNMTLGESPNKDRSQYFQTISREYPNYGRSDFREGALHIINDIHGDTLLDLKYKSYKILDICPNLVDLPHVRNTDQKAETLIITLSDDSLGLEVDLYYIVLSESDVITRFSVIKNNSSTSLSILSAFSMALDLRIDKEWELITLNGAWARERKAERTPISSGIHKIASTQGNSSSAFHNPFTILVRPTTTEEYGEAIASSLIYSGNHIVQLELSTFNDLRLMSGINPFDFSWKLEPHTSFTSPQALLCYSSKGMNKLSQEVHNFVNNRIIAPHWQNHDRYVLINNWEGTYFDFDENKILSIASEAKKLGVELMVLDDGWFGNRNDDFTSLGDWFVDTNELPNGLKSLTENVEALDMKFGLWCEPEMISEESELFKQHPEWRIACPRYTPCQGRNQYVLDMTRDDVIDYLFDRMSIILKDAPISYIKWDKNRNLTDIMSLSLPKNRQKEFSHRYILGLYKLIDRLVQEFPNILFESCASGGNRFDLGMLYYMPQTWTSDNTDAIQRLDIQWGTSLGYPLSAMGAHVSASPNHQTGRFSALELRGAMAFFGTFGYELDPNTLSDEEKSIISKQIQAFKKYRQLIRTGDFHRIQNPDTNVCAWS